MAAMALQWRPGATCRVERWAVVAVLLLAAAMLALAGCMRQPNPLLRKHGIEAFDRRQIHEADLHFSQAVEQDPSDWKSLYYLGRVRLVQNQLFDAQLLLERALAVRRDHDQTPDILDALAQTLYQHGRVQQLHQLLQQAVADYGASRDFMRQGHYLMQLGDRDGAKLAYRKAAFFAAPDDAGPFVALADFYESIGDTPNAITALRHAHAIQPRDQQLRDRLRQHGIVPGPTAALTPARDQP